jgi:hypothetical protein
LTRGFTAIFAWRAIRLDLAAATQRDNGSWPGTSSIGSAIDAACDASTYDRCLR